MATVQQYLSYCSSGDPLKEQATVKQHVLSGRGSEIFTLSRFSESHTWSHRYIKTTVEHPNPNPNPNPNRLLHVGFQRLARG